MKVLAFKMITGEEVLARVNSIKEDALGKIISYEVEDVMTLMVGQGGLGLIPWALANPEATLTIPADRVVVSFSANPDIEKQFLQRTSSIALV